VQMQQHLMRVDQQHLIALTTRFLTQRLSQMGFNASIRMPLCARDFRAARRLTHCDLLAGSVLGTGVPGSVQASNFLRSVADLGLESA